MAATRRLKQHLLDRGFLHQKFNKDLEKPENVEELGVMLGRRRPSLSSLRFSDGDFETFWNKAETASDRNSIETKILPTILGTRGTPYAQHVRFGNLQPLTDGTAPMVTPSFYDGAHPSQISQQVRETLNDLIVPSANLQAPCLPNFLLSIRDPKRIYLEGRVGGWYYGLLAARGWHAFRSQIPSEILGDNNAYVITAAYLSESGMLSLYATYTVPLDEPAGHIQYRTLFLRGYGLTGSLEACREGIAALRNARDWTKEVRDDLISCVNGANLLSIILRVFLLISY